MSRFALPHQLVGLLVKISNTSTLRFLYGQYIIELTGIHLSQFSDRRAIGMWRRDSDCYHFRPQRSTLTPQIGGPIGVGVHNLTLELRPNGGSEQTMCIERYWEVVVGVRGVLEGWDSHQSKWQANMLYVRVFCNCRVMHIVNHFQV